MKGKQKATKKQIGHVVLENFGRISVVIACKIGAAFTAGFVES
jgi:hypothetical protein